jgi:hypothetical protein
MHDERGQPRVSVKLEYARAPAPSRPGRWSLRSLLAAAIIPPVYFGCNWGYCSVTSEHGTSLGLFLLTVGATASLCLPIGIAVVALYYQRAEEGSRNRWMPWASIMITVGWWILLISWLLILDGYNPSAGGQPF